MTHSHSCSDPIPHLRLHLLIEWTAVKRDVRRELIVPIDVICLGTLSTGYANGFGLSKQTHDNMDMCAQFLVLNRNVV